MNDQEQQRDELGKIAYTASGLTDTVNWKDATENNKEAYRRIAETVANHIAQKTIDEEATVSNAQSHSFTDTYTEQEYELGRLLYRAYYCMWERVKNDDWATADKGDWVKRARCFFQHLKAEGKSIGAFEREHRIKELEKYRLETVKKLVDVTRERNELLRNFEVDQRIIKELKKDITDLTDHLDASRRREEELHIKMRQDAVAYGEIEKQLADKRIKEVQRAAMPQGTPNAPQTPDFTKPDALNITELNLRKQFIELAKSNPAVACSVSNWVVGVMDGLTANNDNNNNK